MNLSCLRTREKFPLHLFHMLSHHKHFCCPLILWTGHWLKWKSAHVQGNGGRSGRRKGRIKTHESWLIDAPWVGWNGCAGWDGKWQPQMLNGFGVWSAGMILRSWSGGVMHIARGLGGWLCWKQGDERPLGPKPECLEAAQGEPQQSSLSSFSSRT